MGLDHAIGWAQSRRSKRPLPIELVHIVMTRTLGTIPFLADSEPSALMHTELRL